MKVHKRKKSTRYRGSQTHRRGHRKRTRGLGNQGGKGMSGTGKRGDQKKTLVLNAFGNDYFGRDKALRRGRVPARLKVINLNNLIEGFDNLVKKGIAKQTTKGFEFNLKGYKLLGDGPVGAKISVKASLASESAIAQIKEAGGTIELEPQEEFGATEATAEPKKTEKKVEQKEEKAKPVVKKDVKPAKK